MLFIFAKITTKVTNYLQKMQKPFATVSKYRNKFPNTPGKYLFGMKFNSGSGRSLEINFPLKDQRLTFGLLKLQKN